MKEMSKTSTGRSAGLADHFEAAQKNFIHVVEALSDAQWRMKGVNHPDGRFNDEDETRPVGVIAHHVASTQPWIAERIRAILEDKPTPPVDFKIINAEHAADHAGATRAEVLAMLRDNESRVVDFIRGIPDDKLDMERAFPTGTMSVQQRIERVLIGHMKGHQASIEAATKSA